MKSTPGCWSDLVNADEGNFSDKNMVRRLLKTILYKEV